MTSTPLTIGPSGRSARSGRIAAASPERISRGSAAPLLRETENGVARLLLNRPGKYNALSTGLMGEMRAALDDIRLDNKVRVVIIEGAGLGFCAGHDLDELRASEDREFPARLFRQCSGLMAAITSLPQPVVAKVHGAAAAAGCQLVATCDLAIAAESATFCTPGVNIGLFCSTPMVVLSRNLTRKRALEMLLLGEPIDAARAAAYGLVNFVVPDAELDDEVAGMARLLASKSALTLALGKEAFYRQAELSTSQAYGYASQVMTRNMRTQDAVEGIGAFLDKRRPRWKDR
jgi:enoyl-CoA hydratase/carnithine racemase